MLGCKIVAPTWLPLQAVSPLWATGAKRDRRQPVLTHPPNGGRAYLLARLTRAFRKRNRKVCRQFQLRWSCLSREVGADTRQTKRAKTKTTRLGGICFGSPCWARTKATYSACAEQETFPHGKDFHLFTLRVSSLLLRLKLNKGTKAKDHPTGWSLLWLPLLGSNQRLLAVVSVTTSAKTLFTFSPMCSGGTHIFFTRIL